MSLSLKEIAGILEHPIGDDDHTIDEIAIDTRVLIKPEKSMFVALAGATRHGHRFVHDAYELGVRHFLVEERQKLPSDAVQIVVSNSLYALHRLANAYRQQWSGSVVGITGSNGKTIIKEWVHHLLHEQIHVERSPGSYNSQIGVPLSILGMEPSGDAYIIEAGISQKNEMSPLQYMIDPDIGVLTMIGDAHNAGFNSLSEKLDEKLRLFKSCKEILYPSDDPIVDTRVRQLFSERQLRSVSLSDKNAYYFLSSEGHEASFYKNGERLLSHIELPYSSQVYRHNLAFSLAMTDTIGIQLSDISTRIETLPPLEMRLQIDHGYHGSLVINDSYTADLVSIKSALEFMYIQGAQRRKTLFLAPLEDQQDELMWMKKLAELIKEYPIDRLIVLHKRLMPLLDLVKGVPILKWYASVDDYLSSDGILIEKEDIVLLKGSRQYKLERLHRKLTKHTHRTVLELDLAALQHNLKTISGRLKPSTKSMAMVKASAYGSGMIDIARHLDYLGIDYLGVAFPDEGIQLREAGIKTPIMVMSADDVSLDEAHEYKLEVTAHNRQTLESLLRYEHRIPVHIHIDTGMHRLGWTATEVVEENWKRYNALDIRSIYSHLAASEDSNHDSFTHNQARSFHRWSGHILSQITQKPMRHLLNSWGVVRFPEYQYDMIRLGIGLYGVENQTVKAEELKAVHTLRSYIQEIRLVHKGESVSYGRKYFAEEDRYIGIVPIGYADGLPRSAGQGRYYLISGEHKLPIIGTVCMDFCMVDCGVHPRVRVGDEVIIYGKQHPVSGLAAASDTISYEILSRISPRIPRVLIQ